MTRQDIHRKSVLHGMRLTALVSAFFAPLGWILSYWGWIRLLYWQIIFLLFGVWLFSIIYFQIKKFYLHQKKTFLPDFIFPVIFIGVGVPFVLQNTPSGNGKGVALLFLLALLLFFEGIFIMLIFFLKKKSCELAQNLENKDQEPYFLSLENYFLTHFILSLGSGAYFISIASSFTDFKWRRAPYSLKTKCVFLLGLCAFGLQMNSFIKAWKIEKVQGLEPCLVGSDSLPGAYVQNVEKIPGIESAQFLSSSFGMAPKKDSILALLSLNPSQELLQKAKTEISHTVCRGGESPEVQESVDVIFAKPVELHLLAKVKFQPQESASGRFAQEESLKKDVNQMFHLDQVPIMGCEKMDQFLMPEASQRGFLSLEWYGNGQSFESFKSQMQEGSYPLLKTFEIIKIP